MAETTCSINPFLIAFAGGVLPALVWLWFWLKQDRENPEPRGLITLSFVAGMAVVFFVLPVQKLIVTLMPFIMDGVDLLATKFALVPPVEETVQAILWSFTEEFGVFATVLLAQQPSTLSRQQFLVLHSLLRSIVNSGSSLSQD